VLHLEAGQEKFGCKSHSLMCSGSYLLSAGAGTPTSV